MDIITLTSTWTDKEATFYDLDYNGLNITVKRNHFPEFSNKPITYVMDPIPEGVDEQKALKFLWSSVPEDFRTYEFRRKAKGGFADVVDKCYSKEQAEYLAKKLADEDKGYSYIVVSCYIDGKYTVVKDFTAKQQDN